MRDSSSGPMSEIVARTGWPCSPNTSHKVLGQAIDSGASRPRSSSTAASLGLMLPAWVMPVRSPFDVGHEDRHADLREILGQGLQGDGLARAGGAGDQAVAIGQAGQQAALDVAMLGNQDGVGHGFPL